MMTLAELNIAYAGAPYYHKLATGLAGQGREVHLIRNADSGRPHVACAGWRHAATVTPEFDTKDVSCDRCLKILAQLERP